MQPWKTAFSRAKGNLPHGGSQASQLLPTTGQQPKILPVQASSYQSLVTKAWHPFSRQDNPVASFTQQSSPLNKQSELYMYLSSPPPPSLLPESSPAVLASRTFNSLKSIWVINNLYDKLYLRPCFSVTQDTSSWSLCIFTNTIYSPYNRQYVLNKS